ncbi:MAG: hypothetical protein HC902_10310 [Calothrix sp. SM1_5_4]|nr:hypothetical protein [Calothrix sp. SM1_5_4]
MLTLLLFQFQNCAPAGTSASAVSDDGSDARIVDDWSKTEIQFVAPEVQLHDEALSASVDGFCNRSHNGARLKWTVWADRKAAEPLVSGDSSCRMGQFKVELSELESLVCGVDHLLAVEADWGGVAYSRFIRRCQPLASESLEVAAAHPVGTRCQLEFSKADDLQAPCREVCYREEKLVSERPVEAVRCSGLAARLTGP